MSADAASTERLDSAIPGAFPDANTGQTSPTVTNATASTHQTLAQALFERRAEYTRPRNVRIKIGSWNVATQKGVEQDLGDWFVHGKGIEPPLVGLPSKDSSANTESVKDQEARFTKGSSSIPHNDQGSVPSDEDVGIYALGLQEIVDITSPAEALRPFTDPTVSTQWKTAVETALPQGYQLVAEQQLIGLLLLVYAAPTVYPHIKNVSTTSVGTGLMGYMGNKGAVTARMILGETTRLVFVNSHLAAGADKAAMDRRNWDAGQITNRTRFDPIIDSTGVSQGQGEGLGEEDFAFWFGDLNYRLEGMPGDDVRRLLTFHTKDLDRSEPARRPSTSNDSGYASKTSSEASDDPVPLPPELDPASLQTTISCLLPHDELHQQMRAGKAFHDGWEEGPIRFLPSYKYDVGTVGVFDSSEKRRCPSWCDRILYRTRAAKQRYDSRRREQEESRKKDEEMKAKGMDHAGEDDEVLYDYDPDNDGDNNGTYDEYDENEDPEPEAVTTKDGFSDEILLELYTTHMRVLSSDHKPIEATFLLKYDAVIPDLKASIYAEVARELDRQENEGRPSITVVVDRSSSPAKEVEDGFDGVDFGDVHYSQSKRRNLTIANTGRVPATFGFVDRPTGEGHAGGSFPSWLSVTFDREPQEQSQHGQQQYTLEPADVLNAEFKLKIDNIETVRALNEGTASLDEILVLRVENGRDHFLPIRARWQQSALARTIDKLIKIPEGGIRKLQHQKPDCSDDNGVKWSVPRELFRLTEVIEDLTGRTLAEWEIASPDSENKRPPWQDNAGWPFVRPHSASTEATNEHEEEIANVYDALDCDTPFNAAFDGATPPEKQVEILAQILLLFLSSLTDGIITKSLWEKLEEGLVTRERSKQQLDADDEKMWVLEILSTAPNHNASFLLLLSMMQNITHKIVGATKPKADPPRFSTDLPASPQVSVRRKTLSKVPEVAIRQLINRNYASIFADVVFRSKEEARLKEKDKAIRKERMTKIIELFLSSGEEEQRLP